MVMFGGTPPPPVPRTVEGNPIPPPVAFPEPIHNGFEGESPIPLPPPATSIQGFPTSSSPAGGLTPPPNVGSPSAKKPSWGQRLLPWLPTAALGGLALGKHELGNFAQGWSEGQIERWKEKRQAKLAQDTQLVEMAHKAFFEVNELPIDQVTSGKYPELATYRDKYQQFMSDGELTPKEASELIMQWNRAKHDMDKAQTASGIEKANTTKKADEEYQIEALGRRLGVPPEIARREFYKQQQAQAEMNEPITIQTPNGPVTLSKGQWNAQQLAQMHDINAENRRQQSEIERDKSREAANQRFFAGLNSRSGQYDAVNLLSLSNKFETVATPYRQAADAASKVMGGLQAAAKGDVAGDDLAIKAFQRFGSNDRVTEVEEQRATSIGGPLMRARAIANNWTGKGRLTPEQRQDIANATQQVWAALKPDYEQIRKKASAQASYLKLPADLIIGEPLSIQAPHGLSAPPIARPSKSKYEKVISNVQVH